MIYNHETDLWIDSNQRSYMKNEFSLLEPHFIDVSNGAWTGVWKGQYHEINWNDIQLPVDILNAIKHVAGIKLKSGKVALTYIGALKALLIRLQCCWPSECQSFHNFGMIEFSEVWSGLTSHNRQIFRQLFKEISDSGIFGADVTLTTCIEKWKARNNVKTLKGVLEWNSMTGSLTSGELLLLREALIKQPENETDKNHAIRILCWILLETMKRPQQIISIKADGLKAVVNEGVTEYFLEVPKSKYQTGEQPELWSISMRLATEIAVFNERSVVRKLQGNHNKLVTWKNKCLERDHQPSSGVTESEVKNFVSRLGIISPRTGKALHITPYRLRHTSATHMAMQGVSRDVIQNILEHDDSTSADAYIDAVGSELVPAIERVDRNLGGIFKGLNDLFFKGQVVKKLAKEKIFIPIFNANPMPVGSCGLDSAKYGTCKKQPFTACYDGCPSFLAWNEADHNKALQYVENEFERWSSAEGHNAHSKAIKDFERLHHAISEVISQIDERKSHAAA